MNIVIILILFIFAECAELKMRKTMSKISKNTNGFDQRPLVPESSLLRSNIIDYFDKKRKLDMLEDSQISIHIKTRILGPRYITPPNIFAGGLMKDFLFDFEN